VLYDGTILSGRGLNRPYGIVFRVPAELEALLPTREACTDPAVAKTMRFLTDEWLCDVATDYQGKCIIIACALTILQRALLPQRPAFFIIVGQRGGGKTTTIYMISVAALGLPAAAGRTEGAVSGIREALCQVRPALDCAGETASRAAVVVGKAHARQMNAATRAQWRDELGRNRSASLDAPNWLWSSIVELVASHEAAYLEHCRRYAIYMELAA